MRPIIYTMTFANQATYVGSTSHFARRRHAHRHDLRKGKGINAKVRAAYSANGAPTFAVVASHLSGAVHELEALVIESLQPELNMSVPSPLPSSDKGPRREYGPHKTILDFANAVGVSYNTAKRYSAKYSYEAALYKIAYKLSPKKVERKKPHPLVTALAERTGLTIQQAAGYFYNFKTYDAALAAFLRKRPKQMPTPAKYFTWNGQRRKRNDWAKDNGVSINVLYQRIHAGWPVEQAVGLVPRTPPVRHSDEEAPAHQEPPCVT